MTKHSIINLSYRILIAVILLALILAIAPSLVVRAATVRYVKPEGLASGACGSWGNACSLQYALGIAISTDELWVMQGTYYPTSGSDRNVTIQLKTGVGLYGGFDGTETIRTQRDWINHVTTLSGDIGTKGNITDNSYNVVTGSGTDGSAVLDGFTVTGGNANGGTKSYGGGMINISGGPSLTNIIFDGNTASYYGGGLFNYGSSLSLAKVTFINNTAAYGGGMYNNYSDLNLSDLNFDQNTADYGGGMYNTLEIMPTVMDLYLNDNSATNLNGAVPNYLGVIILEKGTFDSNSATYYGGGIYNHDSNPSLTDVTFTENSAEFGGGMYNSNSKPSLLRVTFTTNSAVNGGGIFNIISSNPSLTEVTFDSNSASTYGGGMYIINGSSSLVNVTFIGNSADNEGGGMYIEDSTSVSLSHVVFTNNTAQDAGGMLNHGTNTNLVDVTFNGNSADQFGGGILNHYCNPHLSNVTFTSNTANNGGGMYSDGSNPYLANVTFQGNSAVYYGGGMYNISSSPDLEGVIFNGNSAIIQGGGMFNNSSGPYLTDVTFESNSANDSGGGVFNQNSSSNLENVTFSGNSALNEAGGMYNLNSPSINLSNVNFTNNTAVYAGGMLNHSSNTTLEDVAFVSNSADYYGGGLFNRYSNPNLTNVTFTSNTASNGGGMYSNSSNPNLENVTFHGNAANYFGGGMYNLSSNPTLENVTFNGNSAINQGGGMFSIDSTSPSLTDVTFDSNSANDNGGGMYNQNSNPSLAKVTFSGNSAIHEGGGMYNFNSTSISLIDVAFTNNTAGYGGGMLNHSSNTTLVDITFIANSADNYGGGMFNRYSNPNLTNVVFINNSAMIGGGICDSDGSNPNLVNVSFYGNSASIQGGGIYNFSSSPNIYNSILWENNPTQVYNDATSTPTIDYSDLEGGCPAGSTCPHFKNSDPLFLNPTSGDLRLGAGSPAIDAGDNSRVPLGILYDLLGNPRFVDILGVTDTGSGTPPIVDMGAFEFGDNQPTAIDDSYSTNENTPLVVPISGVLSNDIPNGGALSAFVNMAPAYGTLTLNANGSFNYTPDEDYFGTDTFTYQANNTTLNSNVAKVSITVIHTVHASTTTVNCGSGSPVVTYGSSITCVATVTRVDGNHTPGGTVSWTTNGSGSFATSPCTLFGSGGTATCSVIYTPSTRGSGSHLITATYSGNINFTGSIGTQTVTVNRLPASVTPNAASKTYGSSDPALTGTLTGFLPADHVTATYSRTSGETVLGSPYTISATLSPAGVLSNYNITYNTANFTINKKAASATPNAASKTYGNSDPVLTGTLTGFLPADSVTATYSRTSGENVAGSPYTISSTLSPSGVLSNYNITYNTANFTITKRSVTVTANAQSKTVGHPDPVLSYQITSGSLAFSDAFAGALSREVGESVGIYAIQQGTLALNANYTLTYIGANLTITNQFIYLPITLK